MAQLKLRFITDIKDDDYEVVEFDGELDKSTLSEAETQLIKLVDSLKRKYLIMDFRRLKYINSEGIGLLMSLHTKLIKNNKRIFMCGANQNVLSVLDLVGLSKLIPSFAHVADVIKFLKKI